MLADTVCLGAEVNQLVDQDDPAWVLSLTSLWCEVLISLGDYGHAILANRNQRIYRHQDNSTLASSCSWTREPEASWLLAMQACQSLDHVFLRRLLEEYRPF